MFRNVRSVRRGLMVNGQFWTVHGIEQRTEVSKVRLLYEGRGVREY